MAQASAILNTRAIALIALVLAASVFCLRAGDLLTTKTPSPATGHSKERALTSLLEPVTGPGNVRVSITGSGDRSYLILVNAAREATPRSEQMRADIEALVTTATGFDAGRDRLTITQLPFAPGIAPAPAALDWAELAGLGLVMACLLVLLVRQPERAAAAPSADTHTPPHRPVRALTPTPDLQADDAVVTDAAALATRKPDETAALIRSWMRAGKAGSA